MFRWATNPLDVTTCGLLSIWYHFLLVCSLLCLCQVCVMARWATKPLLVTTCRSVFARWFTIHSISLLARVFASVVCQVSRVLSTICCLFVLYVCLFCFYQSLVSGLFVLRSNLRVICRIICHWSLHPNSSVALSCCDWLFLRHSNFAWVCYDWLLCNCCWQSLLLLAFLLAASFGVLDLTGFVRNLISSPPTLKLLCN